LNGALDNAIPLNGATGDFTQNDNFMTLGNNYSFQDASQIDIAEEIVYAGELNFSDRNKVESYLAVKYGMTLNQAAKNNNNYTASNDTIIWNRASNSSYANNITGIGRDDASALMQKQSKSINTGTTGGLVTIYNGSNYTGGVFPTTNAANTNSFASDLSYTLFGDNALLTTLTACSDSNKIARMQRVWKVQQYGKVGAVTLSVGQTAVPNTVKTLIVSSDSTFPSGKITIYPLTAANGNLYASLKLVSGQFFTFGGDSLVVSVNIVQPNCTSTADTATAVVSGGVSPITYSWVPLGYITPSIHNVPAGTYTLTVKQGGGCSYSVPFTIQTVSNVPAPILKPIVPICGGGAATLTITNEQTGASYNWYDSATGGQLLQKDSIGVDSSYTTTVLDTTTTYYIQLASSACASSNRISVVVPVNKPTTSTTPVKICVPATYTFNGKVYSLSGTYKDTLLNGNSKGCDSIAILQLTVSQPTTANITASICYPNTYLFKGALDSVSGTYIDTLTNSGGCDSIVTLHLTVNKPVIINDTVSTCTNPYIFNGKSYTAAGIYKDTVKSSLGCDSIIATLDLKFNSQQKFDTTVHICPSGSFTFHGTSYSTAGNYSDTLINTTGGCDTIATLHLVVNQASTYDTSVTICSGDSVVFDGSVIKTAGTFPFNFTNSVGCDSTVNLTVTVTPKTTPSFSIADSICVGATTPILPTTSLEGIKGTWSPATVDNTQTGTYTFTPNAGQCAKETSVTVTVESKPSVSPISGPQNVPLNAPPIGYADSVANGTWGISPTTIAIINDTGAVTGVSVGTATISYTINSNCGDTTVYFKVNVISPTLFIPNLFTPGGASNRIFYVRGAASEYKEMELRIFDSWGGEIFLSSGGIDDASKGWDGTFKGKAQPTGVYTYVVRITPNIGSTFIKKGSITLIR
jgi:gliding motility-associated-like protein